MDGGMEGRTDGWMDGPGWTDGDGRTEVDGPRRTRTRHVEGRVGRTRIRWPLAQSHAQPAGQILGPDVPRTSLGVRVQERKQLGAVVVRRGHAAEAISAPQVGPQSQRTPRRLVRRPGRARKMLPDAPDGRVNVARAAFAGVGAAARPPGAAERVEVGTQVAIAAKEPHHLSDLQGVGDVSDGGQGGLREKRRRVARSVAKATRLCALTR